MDDYSKLLSRENFQTTIRAYCDENDWELDELDEKIATLRFEDETDTPMLVFIHQCFSYINFFVPSVAIFGSIAEVPHLASTGLLQMNERIEIGHWSLAEVGEEFNYTLNHRHDISVLSSELCRETVSELISVCSQFNKGFLDSLESE